MKLTSFMLENTYFTVIELKPGFDLQNRVSEAENS